ncbi:MAG: hypothetical protein CMM50_06560 [Rhodospirillaceae bacterium]|nr:hypothetical protein [Rhodospirillaceae bacterium]
MAFADPLKVLCLDIEGGYGGSSRSLWESLRHMDRSRIAPEVWCRRAGPIQPLHAEAGIPSVVAPEMPSFSSLKRPSRSAYLLARLLLRWPGGKAFRARLLAAAEAADVVHLNHEALFILARWLKRHCRTPLTMHIRTNLHDTAFSRWQDRSIARTADHLIYITENERETLERLSGERPAGTIIYNIAVPPTSATIHPAIPKDGRFKLVSLSNFAFERGTDRLADIARVLDRMGRKDILIVAAGRMEMPRSSPGGMGRVARNGGDFAAYIEGEGLSRHFLFLGHVNAPEQVLAGADALIKPTRDANPWGRDIIEALAAGVPVVTLGRYNRFVEDRVTGVLQQDFDAERMAEAICGFADDRARAKALGEAGRSRVTDLCDGRARAADLFAVWESVARR